MFNEISRDEAMNIINTHFPHLTKVTSLLLNDPTVCYYLNPDGKWKHFLQEEGLPQGCPFSPVFAALVLHTIMEKLDKKLRHRAHIRKSKKILLDDKEGGITNLLAYVDDLNAVVPYEDCLFFCIQFKKLANEIGLRLNNEKSKILTSINGTSPMKHIPSLLQKEIQHCIQEFTNNKETTNGIKILGFPVGNIEFIQNNLHDTHENVTKAYTTLKRKLNDTQTITQLVNNCLLPKYNYSICSDILYNNTESKNIYDYNSEHINHIKSIVKDLCKLMASSDDIPEYIMELACRPTSQNGLQLSNPQKSSISASCTPLLKSIQMAKFGIKLEESFHKLPLSLQRIYMNWTTSTRTHFTTLRKYLPQIMPIINKQKTPLTTKKEMTTFLDNNPAHRIHDKIIKEFYNKHPDEIYHMCPPEVKTVLPSILNSPIPTTLIRPCRQIKENRLNNFDFTLAFRRSHRLPIIPKGITLTCTCGSPLDIYGDHLFHCKKHSKTSMHNHMRDSIHYITSALGPLAAFMPSSSCCNKEETDLLPSFPSLRPADISIHSSDNPLTKYFRKSHPITAIDCTFTGAATKKQLTQTNYDQTVNNFTNLHLKYEAKKYNRGPYIITKKDDKNKQLSRLISGESIIREMNTQNITLLPFTFDNFGAMGPLAQSFFNDVKKTPRITNSKTLDTFTTEGLKAYTRGSENKKLTSLFKKSNKGYRKTNKDGWYGSTYQLINPSDWGRHNLAMNTNLAILKHIKKGLNIVLKHNLKAEKKLIKKQANRPMSHSMKHHTGKQKQN